jgi:hypothetical protein
LVAAGSSPGSRAALLRTAIGLVSADFRCGAGWREAF